MIKLYFSKTDVQLIVDALSAVQSGGSRKLMRSIMRQARLQHYAVEPKLQQTAAQELHS